MKIFKSTDEPSAPNITQEEYMKIQEEVRKNPHVFKIEEIRKKEVTMDISQQKEPEISWKLPKEIKLDEEIENEFNEHGKESQQKKYIEDLCERELKVYFFDKITEPTELEKKLFSFTDENILKIENSQIATKTNDVTIDDVLKFWDNLGNNINKENLKQLEDLLGKVDIDNNEKQQILEQAQKRYEQELLNSQNYANNNININNNLTINNNQKILSMNNYPNMMNMNMNLNNINQISALSLLNNVKQLQPNLEQITYINPSISNQVPNSQNNLVVNQNYQEIIQQQQPNNQNLNTNMGINNNMVNPLPNMTSMNTMANIQYPGVDQNYFQQQLTNNNLIKSNVDQRMIIESAHRMDLTKYRTKPCRNYHGSIGCTRGDNCFFIHDPNYKGCEIPNFNPRNYESNFLLVGFAQGIGIPPIATTLNAQIGNQFSPLGQLGMNQMNFGLNLQQMMGLPGNMNMNTTNQIINKGENVEMEQYIQNNMINTGMVNNNMEGNAGVNGLGLNYNGFRQITGQGVSMQGYDYNYGVGLQGQNVNQIIPGMNTNQNNGIQ